MYKCALVVMVAIVVFGSTTADAQFTNPYTGSTWNNPVSSFADTLILHSMQRKMLERSVAAQQGKTVPAEKPVKHKRASATDFKPSKNRPAVDAFLASSNVGVEEQKQLRVVFDATFKAVEKELRKHNVASALGFVIGTSIEIANGVEVPDAEARELIAGLNDLLSDSPEFMKLKAKDKQAIYDTLIVSGALLLMFHAAGEEDPAMKATSVELAKSVLAQLTGAKG